ERAPAVLGRLVDVGAGLEQQLRRFDVAFARSQHERREPTAAGADQPGHDHIGIVFLFGSRGGASAGPTTSGSDSLTLAGRRRRPAARAASGGCLLSVLRARTAALDGRG